MVELEPQVSRPEVAKELHHDKNQRNGAHGMTILLASMCAHGASLAFDLDFSSNNQNMFGGWGKTLTFTKPIASVDWNVDKSVHFGVGKVWAESAAMPT